MRGRVLVRYQGKVVAADLIAARSLPEHRVFHGMWARCTNPNHMRFLDYGGKGTKICDRWKDFANFYEDMGPRPSMKHSIDRKDTRGNYEPGNCRWATRTEQSRNRSNPVFVEFKGEQHRLCILADVYGKRLSLVTGRLKIGWSVEDALNTPVGRKGPRSKSS